MSEDKKKNLEELSVQEHLDQIQGRTTPRRKVAKDEATTQDYLDAKHDLVELVDELEAEEDQQEADPEKAPLDVWSVEDHLQEIQDKKRRDR